MASNQGPARAFAYARRAPSCTRPAAGRPARDVIADAASSCALHGRAGALHDHQHPTTSTMRAGRIFAVGPSKAAAVTQAAVPAAVGAHQQGGHIVPGSSQLDPLDGGGVCA